MGCGTGYVPIWHKSPYAGWETSRIKAALKKLDDSLSARAPGATNVTSASVNGKSFTFDSTSSGMTQLGQITEEKMLLLDALSWAETGMGLHSNRAIGVMRAPYGISSGCCG